MGREMLIYLSITRGSCDAYLSSYSHDSVFLSLSLNRANFVFLIQRKHPGFEYSAVDGFVARGGCYDGDESAQVLGSGHCMAQVRGVCEWWGGLHSSARCKIGLDIDYLVLTDLSFDNKERSSPVYITRITPLHVADGLAL